MDRRLVLFLVALLCAISLFSSALLLVIKPELNLGFGGFILFAFAFFGACVYGGYLGISIVLCVSKVNEDNESGYELDDIVIG